MAALGPEDCKRCARDVRAKAEAVGNPGIRAAMMQIAETYEWMADRSSVSSLAPKDDYRNASRIAGRGDQEH